MVFKSAAAALIALSTGSFDGSGMPGTSVLYNYDQVFMSRVTGPFEEKRFSKCHASQRVSKSGTDKAQTSHGLVRLKNSKNSRENQL